MSNISLTPAINNLIDEHLATGRYRTREEVLVKALRQLAHHEELLADLEASADNEAAGRLVDAEEVMAEMETKYGIAQ